MIMSSMYERNSYIKYNNYTWEKKNTEERKVRYIDLGEKRETKMEQMMKQRN